MSLCLQLVIFSTKRLQNFRLGGCTISLSVLIAHTLDNPTMQIWFFLQLIHIQQLLKGPGNTKNL